MGDGDSLNWAVLLKPSMHIMDWDLDDLGLPSRFGETGLQIAKAALSLELKFLHSNLLRPGIRQNWAGSRHTPNTNLTAAILK
jgi:hypothetical protein